MISMARFNGQGKRMAIQSRHCEPVHLLNSWHLSGGVRAERPGFRTDEINGRTYGVEDIDASGPTLDWGKDGVPVIVDVLKERTKDLRGKCVINGESGDRAFDLVGAPNEAEREKRIAVLRQYSNAAGLVNLHTNLSAVAMYEVPFHLKVPGGSAVNDFVAMSAIQGLSMRRVIATGIGTAEERIDNMNRGLQRDGELRSFVSDFYGDHGKEYGYTYFCISLTGDDGKLFGDDVLEPVYKHAIDVLGHTPMSGLYGFADAKRVEDWSAGLRAADRFAEVADTIATRQERILGVTPDMKTNVGVPIDTGRVAPNEAPTGSPAEIEAARAAAVVDRGNPPVSAGTPNGTADPEDKKAE